MSFNKSARFRSASEGDPSGRSYLLPAISLMVLAAFGFMVLGAFITDKGFPFKLSFLSLMLNDLLFSGTPTNLSGNSLLDGFASGFVRSIVLGFVSFALVVVTVLWVRMRDLTQANMFLVSWGVLVGVPFACLFTSGFFIPLIADAASLF